MKKTYIKPEVNIYEMPKQALLAGSGSDPEIIFDDQVVEGGPY